MKKPNITDYCYAGGFDQQEYDKALQAYKDERNAAIASAVVILALFIGLLSWWGYNDKQSAAKQEQTVKQQLAVNAERGFALSPKEAK